MSREILSSPILSSEGLFPTFLCELLLCPFSSGFHYIVLCQWPLLDAHAVLKGSNGAPLTSVMSLRMSTRNVMFVWRYIEERWRNLCYRRKALSITYSECVFVDLVIQHAKRMRRVLSSVSCPAVKYFPTLSHKRHDLRGGGGEFFNPKLLVWVFFTIFV